MRILIVEDDFGSRRLLTVMLKNRATLDVVVSGDEAIEAFRLAWEDNDPYQLILLDIMMPNTDGQTALRMIRAAEREMGVDPRQHVRVIMTSALGDPRNVVQAYRDGEADGYLTKPIEEDKLLETIRSAGIAIP